MWIGRIALLAFGILAGAFAAGHLKADQARTDQAKENETKAGDVELVMFDRLGCVWCLRWEQEIGPIYPQTSEGKLAPLRHFRLGAGQPEGMGLKEPVFYSPTFVLREAGQEVGRITGYSGEYAFWAVLAGELKKLRVQHPAKNGE